MVKIKKEIEVVVKNLQEELRHIEFLKKHNKTKIQNQQHVKELRHLDNKIGSTESRKRHQEKQNWKHRL